MGGFGVGMVAENWKSYRRDIKVNQWMERNDDNETGDEKKVKKMGIIGLYNEDGIRLQLRGEVIDWVNLHL